MYSNEKQDLNIGKNISDDCHSIELSIILVGT